MQRRMTRNTPSGSRGKHRLKIIISCVTGCNAVDESACRTSPAEVLQGLAPHKRTVPHSPDHREKIEEDSSHVNAASGDLPG
jgi:hypothetical protein